MEKINAVFCIRDQNYADQIHKYLEKLDFDKLKITFISEKKINTNFETICIPDYIEKNIKSEVKLDKNIWKNENIFIADPDYVNKKKNLNREYQDHYVNACRLIFQKNNFDIIFSGAAGRMIWTIPHLVALENDVLAYKLQPLDYLNPKFEGWRIWFCTDVFWDVDINSSYDFDWKDDSLNKQINNLQDSLLKENFNLASRALLESENYTPKKFKNILKNLIKIIIYNDHLAKLKFKSIFNAFRNKKIYTSVEDLNKSFIIYPLNQPNDEQLLVRAPNYLKNKDTIKLIARNLPKNIILVVKEHPVNPGMISYKDIKEILSEFNNIVFVNPKLAIRPIILESKGLITVNSTAGIEALMCNKKIIVLGESYYKYNSMVYRPSSETELKNSLLKLISDTKYNFDDTRTMLKKLLNQSYPEPNSYPSKEKYGDRVVGEAIRYKLNQLLDRHK